MRSKQRDGDQQKGPHINTVITNKWNTFIHHPKQLTNLQ